MEFAEALRIVMKEHGVRQRDICQTTGLSPSYISKLVSGTPRDPSFARAAAVISACGMSLDDFVELQSGQLPLRDVPADEAALLVSYRSMTRGGKEAALASVEGLRQAFGRDLPDGAGSEQHAEGA